MWVLLGWHPIRKPKASPPPRNTASGRFRRVHDPYAGLVPVRVDVLAALDCAPGGPSAPAHYLAPASGDLALLPSMQRAVQLKCAPTFAWDPLSPHVADGIGRLLDTIGLVLHRGARLLPCGNVMSGRSAFAQPLDVGGMCMWVDPALVGLQRGVMALESKNGYLSVAIGIQRPSKRPIYERAHRIVAWAMFGMPPAHLQAPVVMHTCGDKTCLNPLHLVWGERALNATPCGALMHARERLDADKRPSPCKLINKLVEEGVLVR